MNTIFLRPGFFYLPSLAALAVLSSGLSAVAETVNTTVDSQQLAEPAVTATSTDLIDSQQFADAVNQELASRTLTPVPGTASTLSAALTAESEPTEQPTTTQVAQADINLGRPTRGGRSYIGVAGNVGLGGGDSSLGDGNFAVVSKIGLTNAISVRPSAVFGNNTTILLPVSYDFSLQQADPFAEPLAIAPFIGVGAAIKTGDDSQAAFLVSGGVDFPLTPQFTATASVNAGFFDQTDVGLLLGVGYNFTGF